jgi:hypothetical protein
MAMLDWLEKKPDHPMTSLAEARALLAELPEDPQKALADATHWIDSVRDTPGFRVDLRAQVLGLIDETAQSMERAVLALYLARPHLRQGAGKEQWQSVLEFWSGLASGYGVCRRDYQAGAKGAATAKDLLVQIGAREIRALGQRMKLLLMRYQPVEDTLWAALHQSYAFAESLKHAANSLRAYPNDAIDTSVRTEFAKALMLETASAQSLSTPKIELAFRIIYRFAPLFVLGPERAAGATFVTDLSAPKPPRAVSAGEQPAPTLRFFGMGEAGPKLEEMITQNEQGLLAEEHRLGKDFSSGEKITVLRHLLTYWGANPPRRTAARVQISGELSVVHGYRAVCRHITNIEAASMGEVADNMDVTARQKAGLDLASEEIKEPPELWMQQDASDLGVGALVPANAGKWVAVGCLCAIKPAGDARWWAGVVRRLRSDEKNRVGAGIEVLAKKPAAVWLRALGRHEAKVSDWETVSGSFAYEYLHAVMLTDHAKANDRPVLLLEKNRFVPGQIYEMMVGDKSRHVILKQFLEQGEDYDLGSFEWYQGEVARPA